MTTGEILRAAIFLAVVIAISWRLPRRFGILGLFAGHVLVVIAMFLFTAVAIEFGTYEYEGGEAIIGLAFMAFVLNVALLPVAIVALSCHYGAKRPIEPRGNA